MSANSVQRAHDELLRAMPSGAVHDGCPLCHPGAGTEKAEEVRVAEERTFTEAQHFALLTDAVARETASLSTVKEQLEQQVQVESTEKAALQATVTELETRIDVLDAEKAAAESARDAAVAEFQAYKDAEAEKAAVQARKTERVAAVKAADSALPEEYFTDARAQRWAEMADDSFAALVADLTEAASHRPATTAAETAASTEAVRETAAFKGGDAPTSGSGQSLFGQFLSKTGHAPAAV
jgi:hypothetical protein